MILYYACVCSMLDLWCRCVYYTYCVGRGGRGDGISGGESNKSADNVVGEK